MDGLTVSCEWLGLKAESAGALRTSSLAPVPCLDVGML